MSGKKNKRPFNENNEDESIGFHNPEHRRANEDVDSEGIAISPEASGDEDLDTEDDEEGFDDEERGWHTFDMDNPDESL